MLKKMYDLQKKKGKKGFSMIELIIVLAIMAILVALIGTQLIPYLDKSREKRDMTTMDTCLTAFESCLADNEKVLSADTQLSAAISAGDVTQADFESYAGIAVDDATVFKSKKAKGYKPEDITFVINSDGVITGAKVGASGSELEIKR